MCNFLKVGLAVLVSLHLFGCDQQQKQQQAPQPSAQANQHTWNVGNYVNEFGDPTGFKYVYTETTGRFSNSATNNSALTVVVMPFRGENIHGDTLGNVSFKLLEYGNHWVKGKGVLNVSAKGNDGKIIKALCYNDNRGETVLHGYSTGLEPDSIFNMLLAGGKVMFSMETSKAPYSSYKFIIVNADGLQEALELANK